MPRLGVIKSRFFWKIFLTYSLLFVVLTSIISWQFYDQFLKSLKQNLNASLRHKLEILIPYAEHRLTGKKMEGFESLIQELGKKTETRITIVDAFGTVIADSDADASVMENHGDRPEIAEARLHSIGAAERMSVTTGAPFVYLAQGVKHEGQLIGFVRVAWPKSRLDGDLDEVLGSIILTTILGIAVALVIAFFVAREVAIPVAEMMRVCDAMRRGHYDEKVKTISRDEIGRLGETLNQLGQEMTQKLSLLSLERAQLNSMLAGMVEGIIAVDNHDRLRFCNRAACKLLGVLKGNCEGVFLGEIPGFDILQPIIKRARDMRELLEEELPIELGPESRLLEIHASYFEGIDSTGVIVVLHDITKVRHLEKMRRDFVANVSHEIKTPLTSIKGYVETILENAEIDRDTRERFLAKIARNANRLMNLVQDILSLAQIESHQDQIPLRPTDVGPIARQVVSQYEPIVQDKNIEIKINEIVKPLVVLADRESLYQIIDNLFTNAVRYTPPGGKVQINLSQDNFEGRIDVEDTGIGIPQKYIGRIFERFYRVDKARSRELGGTGLGLAIVKHLISSMGGRVIVESQVGVGSKFSVILKQAR